MILSQIFFWFTASMYTPSNVIYDTVSFNLQNTSFFVGLFFLALGTSFSTLSITHIINTINNDETSRIKGFSIFYPILNIGVLIGVLIVTVIIGDENYELYELVFAAFATILTVGLICFRLFKNKYLIDNDGNLMKDESFKESISDVSNNILKKLSDKSISEINVLNLKERRKLFKNSLNPHEKDRMAVFLIFLVIIIFYRIAYSQTSISIVFFIDSFVETDIGLFEIPIQAFFLLNPIFVLILSPIFIKINDKIKEKGIGMGFINRSIIALLVMTFCYIILSAVGYYIDIDAVDKINFAWIVIFEFFIVLSELYFAIAGYSMVGNLSPKKYYSLFFGLFTATRAIAMFFTGRLSSHFPPDVPPTFINNIPINGLMNYFLIFVIMNLLAAAVLIVYRKKIKAKLHLEELNN